MDNRPVEFYNTDNYVEEFSRGLPHLISRRKPILYPRQEYPVEQTYSTEDAKYEGDMRDFWKTPISDATPIMRPQPYSNGEPVQPDDRRMRGASYTNQQMPSHIYNTEPVQPDDGRMRGAGYTNQQMPGRIYSNEPVHNYRNNVDVRYNQGGGPRTCPDQHLMESQRTQNMVKQMIPLFAIQSEPIVHAMEVFKRMYWKIYGCYTPSGYFLHYEKQYSLLSKDIWQRYLFYKPEIKEFMTKINIWKQLQSLLDMKKRSSNYTLLLTGSTLTGLSISGSDMDLCLYAPDNPGVRILNALFYHLECIRILFMNVKEIDNINTILKKVPVVKFTVLTSKQINVDITCNTSISVANSQLVYRYVKCDWRLQPLYSVVKQWAIHHDINNSFASTFSNYTVTLLVINFLQCGVSPPVLPCLHDILGDELKSWKDLINSNPIKSFQQWDASWTSLNTMSLGELLINFFKYYKELDFKNYIISVRRGSIIKRSTYTNENDRERNYALDLIFVEEPFLISNAAIGIRSQRAFEAIKTNFSNAEAALRNTMKLENIFE